jgi:NADPH-ferrihemoprotein reductase
MKVLYGSQSGTSEGFAEQIDDEARAYGFKADVCSVEEFDFENELESTDFVLFLMSTFGEGEPTDDAVDFYTWLTDDGQDADMSNVNFAVFALGNRQWEFFCQVGRTVSEKMRALNGQELLEHGEGDDDGTLDDDFEAWREDFWAAARKKFINDSGEVHLTEAKFEPKFTIEWLDEKEANAQLDKNKASTSPSVYIDPKHDGDYVTVLENYELRSDVSDGGSTRHIVLDTAGTKLNYTTADNLGILPRNSHQLAARLAKLLHVKPNSVFRLHPKGYDKKAPIIHACSVMDALLWYCDITSMPKRHTLELLAGYATDMKEKDQLKRWAHEDKEAFAADMKSIVEVIEECPSAIPPFEHFVGFCPRLQPRFYTISSSSRANPGRITVTATVTRDQKPRDRIHRGVCTTYLASLEPKKQPKIAAFVRPSTFSPSWDSKIARRSDSKTSPPMIMVGPGTGVAPFRAFLEEAAHLQKQGHALGDMVLFFGCQKKEKDFIYREEFEGHNANGIAKVITAFSRETATKVYVQHKMVEHSEMIWKLINDHGAFFFICGGTQMGRDVRKALVTVLCTHGNMSETAASDYIKKLQSDGRYVQELWS